MRVQIDATIEKADQKLAVGTGLQGYFSRGTTYKALVEKLGKPNAGESGDGKVKAEWIVKLKFHRKDPGIIFTIYDYKSSVAPEENTDWHIGGKGQAMLEIFSQVMGIGIEND